MKLTLNGSCPSYIHITSVRSCVTVKQVLFPINKIKHNIFSVALKNA